MCVSCFIPTIHTLQEARFEIEGLVGALASSHLTFISCLTSLRLMDTLFGIKGAAREMSWLANIIVWFIFLQSSLVHWYYYCIIVVWKIRCIFYLKKERFQYTLKIKIVRVESTTLILNYTIYVLKQKFNFNLG